MKRVVLATLLSVLVLAFAGCGGSNTPVQATGTAITLQAGDATNDQVAMLELTISSITLTGVSPTANTGNLLSDLFVRKTTPRALFRFLRLLRFTATHLGGWGQHQFRKGEAMMRIMFLSMLLAATVLANPQQNAPAAAGVYTLTVVVENINKEGGNIGVLVFNSTKGWPEDRFAALKDVVVPAHPGTVNVIIPGLPAGDYALAVLHDVNKNHKLDKNLFGVPKEQWGMSNNPHATIKAPAFSAAKFSLTSDVEVRVRMQ